MLAQEELDVVLEPLELPEEPLGRQLLGRPLAQRGRDLAQIVVKTDEPLEDLADRAGDRSFRYVLELLMKPGDLLFLEAVEGELVAELAEDR